MTMAFHGHQRELRLSTHTRSNQAVNNRNALRLEARAKDVDDFAFSGTLIIGP